jgi:hypothetical protein
MSVYGCFGVLSNIPYALYSTIFPGRQAQQRINAIAVITTSMRDVQSRMDACKLSSMQYREEARTFMMRGQRELAKQSMTTALKALRQMKTFQAALNSLQGQVDVLEMSETNRMLAKTFKRTAAAMKYARAPDPRELERSIAAIEAAGDATVEASEELSAPLSIGEVGGYTEADIDEELDALLTEESPSEMTKLHVGGFLPSVPSIPHQLRADDKMAMAGEGGGGGSVPSRLRMSAASTLT